MNKGILIGAVAVIGSVAAALGLSTVSKAHGTPSSGAPSQTLTTLNLGVNNGNISVDGSSSFTVTALDQNGNSMSGRNLTLFEQTTMQAYPFPPSDSTGTAYKTLVFPNTGSFVFYAE